jgi:cytochrome c-type biogenesis protein CcmF
MPWLIGTALLHSALVAEKRDTLKAWTILLAILAFALSLIGTFLVRSGVLTSVHAFATDPSRGVFILVILIIAIGGSLGLFAWRAPALRAGGFFAPVSREGALVINNLILATACAVVFIGTLYPLFLDVFGRKISVGPQFFNATFVPLMIPLLAVTAIGPFLAWKRGDLRGAISRLVPAGIAALLAVAAARIFGGADTPWLAYPAIAAAAWLATGTLAEFAQRVALGSVSWRTSFERARGLRRSAWGLYAAHLGAAFAVAGMVGSASWQSESILTMKPGDSAAIAGWQVKFVGTELERASNYVARRALIEVRYGDHIEALRPAKRVYLSNGMVTTETAIRSSGFADLYVTIADTREGTVDTALARHIVEAPEDAAWVVRLHHNPLVPWIWLGAALAAFGGVLSLSDRRLRVGTPQRAGGGATSA